MERIFGGASTFSKMHCNFPENYPIYFSGEIGESFIDEHGNIFFDTMSGLGSRLLKFSIGKACGMMSLPSVFEKELSDRLCSLLPFIEMVRYGNNGADATEGAIRYARAFTGKPCVVSCGYHSCQSAFTFNTPPALGCIDGRVKQFPDMDRLINYIRSYDNVNDVAAVIVEPLELDLSIKDKISELREITTRKKIVLIFDEIITGFRVPKFCVSNWWDIHPDMILLGKAIGGGYPLSIIGGKAEIMDRPVFMSYTFAGFPAAIKEAISIINSVDVDKLQQFWDRAKNFNEAFNALDFNVKLAGYPTRGVWKGPQETIYLFWQEMLKLGFFIGPAFFPRISWNTYDFEALLSACRECSSSIRSGNVKLEGRYPAPIFKRNS